MSVSVCRICSGPCERRSKTCSPKCGYELRSRIRNGEVFSETISIDRAKESSRVEEPFTVEPAETQEHRKDEWNIHLRGTRIHTLEQLIAHCEIDVFIWEVERFVVNKWEVGAKDSNGKIAVEPLFQVKAWLRKRVAMALIKDEIESLRAAAEKHMPKKFPGIIKRHRSGLMLEPSIYDLHVGKLAWGRETGHEDYDSKIAQGCFDRAFDNLLGRTSEHKFERIVYVVGNDLHHTDSKTNTTFSGTQMDSDTRYFKSCELTREIQCKAIETLMQLAPVDVYMVGGNHDPMTTWHLGDSIKSWFRNAKHVNVMNEPTKRKYCQWGQVMLCFTHGETEKHDKLGNIMAAEQRKMWGDTRFHEAHVGDLHTTRFDVERVRSDIKRERAIQEAHGVRVRIIPSLCPPDAWHAAQGYIGNLRSAEAFVWHQEEGLIGTAIHTETGDEAA